MKRPNSSDRDTRRLEFPAGHYLIRQGDVGDQAWLIESGTLDVIQATSSRPRVLAQIGQGAIVGEMALIDRGQRTASVIARTAVCCVELNQALYQQLIKKCPPLAAYMLESLVSAVRRAYGFSQEERTVGGTQIRSVLTNEKILDRRVYSPGHHFFNQDDPGTSAYLIQSGCVSIQRTMENRTTELGQLGPGRIFGELALISGAARLASAIAVERTVCEVISKDVFDRVIASMPPILRALTKIYVTQLSSAGRKAPDS